MSLEICNGNLDESLEIGNGKFKMIKWVWKSEMEIWMRVLNNFNDFDNF